MGYDPKTCEFLGIQKVPWDALWHVMYKTPSGCETSDRITKSRALAIEKSFESKRRTKKGR